MQLLSANNLPISNPPTPQQVAALEHFRTVPASVLAAAALEGPDALEEVLEGLNTATLSEVRWARCCSLLGCWLSKLRRQQKEAALV